MISNSKILVTGGCGFIGAHLAKLLADEDLNNHITLYDINIGAGTTAIDLGLDNYNNINIIKGSILNRKDLFKLPGYFDYIVHAAGFLGIQQVAIKQLETLDINIMGTRNCLDLAVRQSNQPYILLFSTSEIYGTECSEPDESDASLIPTVGKRWSYAASKLTAEYYLKAYINEYSGLRGSIVRPFNVFGAYRYGSNAMTTIVDRALENLPITISGDGTQIRSWCSITDFCRGIALMLSNADGIGEAYNIGDPRNTLSMKLLAEKIVRLTNSESKIIIAGDEPEDVQLRVPNIMKAKTVLGYEPREIFDNEILDVMEWLQKKQEKPSLIKDHHEEYAH